MINLLSSDKEILSGLISIIKKHRDNFTSEDLQLLKGINYIINCLDFSIENWAKGQFDESKVNRDVQGRFAETNKQNSDEVLDEVTEHSKNQNQLNPREIISLYIAARGDKNKDISNNVLYSIHTSKSDMSNIFKKLNAKNRTDAVVQAIRYGILDISQIDINFDENKRQQNELSNIDRTLTDTEKNLLLHLAAGLKVKQVAADIWGKSESLAKVYKQSILDKFEVNDETAAVVVGLQHKIITLDEIMEIRKRL